MADTLLKLNTGASIPALGLGAWRSAQGQAKKTVSHALASGYKHIDCAYVYGNEDEVGEGLKESSESGAVKPEDIDRDHEAMRADEMECRCTYHSRVEENLDMSPRSLGLDYVDLYLMRWPCPMNPNGNDPKFPKYPDGSRDLDASWTHIQTYQHMERLLPTGKVKAIGVVNYSVRFLQELLPHVAFMPAVNQIENQPYLPQQDIVDFCREKGIHITAYSLLGNSGSPLLQDEHVGEVAKET